MCYTSLETHRNQTHPLAPALCSTSLSWTSGVLDMHNTSVRAINEAYDIVVIWWFFEGLRRYRGWEHAPADTDQGRWTAGKLNICSVCWSTETRKVRWKVKSQMKLLKIGHEKFSSCRTFSLHILILTLTLRRYGKNPFPVYITMIDTVNMVW